MNRREFLRQGLLVSASGLLLFRGNAWAARAIGEGQSRKRLVVAFLRGAVDGLNVLVPYSESSYYSSRPTIAIPRPGENGGALGLDGHFGLHPALSPIMPLWEKGTLAFVHASGSPDSTRSHFDAQDYMETATPGAKTTPDGWLNRLLEVLPGRRNATDAISVGPTLPRILSGRISTTNLPLKPAGIRPMATDRAEIEAAFDRLYNGNDPLSIAYREGQSARKKLMAELAEDMKMADGGAPSPIGFAAEAQKLGRLIARDATIKVAFIALGGWDTHVNQGSSTGQLANRLKALGDTLATFVQALGSSYSDTVILVMSEFGRTAQENGNAGTDHGHGNVMWIAGGHVQGGKVYGQWPGLSGNELYEGRDLAITTDFREVISALLESQFGLTTTQLEKVVPKGPKPPREIREIFQA
ncbi:MAG: DUF1501 domain-containing protein [Deltaproteobacteria bacterium]|nr:DUF1501 domain-containing protein [Deltaproteobacteria bacterium]